MKLHNEIIWSDVMVSIIIPVYNSENYLTECIESVLNQTYSNFELILINDGSIDSSGEICNYYKSVDNRVIVIHQENKGISETRNIGLEIAKGEFILFVDNDDLISPDLLHDNIELLNQTDLDVVKFSINYLYIDQCGTEKEVNKYHIESGCYSRDEIREKYKHLKESGVFTFIWNMLIRRSILSDNNIIFDKNALFGGEDNIFNYKILKYSNGLICNSKAYYTHFRRIGQSASTKYSLNKIKTVLNIMKAEKEFFCQYNINHKLWNEYVVEYTSFIIYQVFDKRNDMKYKDKTKFLDKLQLKEYLNFTISIQDWIKLLIKKPKYTIVTVLFLIRFYKIFKLLKYRTRKE
jgi:glycosyltransferase involved in cell wall biosynthesis